MKDTRNFEIFIAIVLFYLAYAVSKNTTTPSKIHKDTIQDILKSEDQISWLGNGSYGAVRKVTMPNGVKYAVKSFLKCPKLRAYETCSDAIKREYWFATAVENPNIARSMLLSGFQDDFHHVLEYLPYKLSTMILEKETDPKQIVEIFKQVIQAVDALHENGIAHRDLKLDNVLLNGEREVKLIDFGSAETFQLSRGSEVILSEGLHGSLPYLAPETLTGEPYDPRATDVWSLAIVYVAMTLKRTPWGVPRLWDVTFRNFSRDDTAFISCRKYRSIQDLPHLQSSHLRGPDTLIGLLPESSRPLIDKMMNMDPLQRPTVKEILQDEWLRSSTLQCLNEYK